MGVSILFLIVMVLVGGAVAYLGDHIGRSIGKKRLRVGRLRPKHTAMIGTFVAGMLGTLATILILFAIAEPVRVWITEGDKARIEAEQLKKEREKLQSDVNSKQADLVAMNDELTNKDKLIADRDKTLDDKNKEIASLQSQQSKLANQVSQQTKKADQAQASLKTSQSNLAELEAQLSEIKVQITDSRTALGSTQKENVALQKANFELQRTNTDLENQINSNNDTIRTLGEDIKRMEEAQKALDASYQALVVENRNNLQKLTDEFRQAQSQLADTNSSLQRLRAEAKALLDGVGISRTNPLTYNLLDELSRTSIPASSTSPTVQAIINSALNNAESIVRLKGAKPGENGRVINILTAQIQKQSNGPSLTASLDQAIEFATGRNEPTLVRVFTFFNAFLGEQVVVGVHVLPNPVVYQAEETILTLQIDGTLPEDQIIDKIYNYLQENLYTTAVKAGMVPALGQEAPIGEVTRDQILEMASRVKAANRSIRLQILAQNETRAGDKLRLAFRLRI